MSTLVLAYTPTPPGDAALSAALREARRRSWRLVVVNATKGDAVVDPRFLGDSDRPGLEERLVGSGVDYEVVQELGPDPAEIVLDRAVAVDAALVVIGLRRRSPVGKLLMGSVAQRILLDAPMPVLAVHA